MAWYKCSGGGEGIPLITKSGSIVEYEDSVGGVPVNDLVASIVATQSGTGDPSPSNVRPISGYTGVNVVRCGSNLWNEDWEVGGINDTTGQPNSDTNKIRSKSFFAIKGGETYYVVAPQPIRILFYADDESFISETSNIRNNTFSVPANASKAKIRGTVDYGTVYNRDISINYPATDTTYHAYSATIYSVTWQTEAGTVYGGYIDLTTGLLTVTHGFKTFDHNSSWIAEYLGTVNGYNFYVAMGAEYQALQDATVDGFICNASKPSPVLSARKDRCYISAAKNLNFTWGDTLGISTLAEFKNYLETNNLVIQVVAKLATPQTYQLTPKEVEVVLGINNIFADTGDIDVKFYKPVTNLDTLVEQTKNLAPDLLALASAGNGTSTREAFDMTDETTGTKATRIPDYMFYKNLNVEKINLSTVESVGSNSFYMCPYLKEINLPNATELKSSAFNASSRSLVSPAPMVINLPSVITLNDSALREMGYEGVPTTLTLTACETVSANSVRGASGRYFVIDTLDLPAVKTIGQESFNYHQFTNVIIGTVCTSIASKPFNYCTITNLTVKANTPPTLNANGLGCTPTHIYVPSDSVNTYKTASAWSTYASIIEAIPT